MFAMEKVGFLMKYMTKYASPVGELTLLSDGAKLTDLLFEKEKYYSGKGAGLTEKDDLQVFSDVKSWLDRYFAGERPDLQELPLAPEGSPFRQAVWGILKEIPYGEVTTYGAIAQKIAVLQRKKHMSAQAVGGAVGHNPISIIIPCHRVIGSNGSLTGFGGGIDNKVKLLEHEQVDMAGMFVPKKGTAL